MNAQKGRVEQELCSSERTRSGENHSKVALVLGVTGQTGSYLADLLLFKGKSCSYPSEADVTDRGKGYTVHGVTHSSWQNYPQRLEHIMRDDSTFSDRFILHQGDIEHLEMLVRLLTKIAPDEVYNLAAQSSVHLSFEQPISTIKTVGLGVINVLEAIKLVNRDIKLFQASSSEIFGHTRVFPQDESTPTYPSSPYAVAKLTAFAAVRMYREAYGLKVCSGILYNHESSRRGGNFVTQKIINAVVKIKYGLQSQLELGNLDSRRDWGHARDFVLCMWKMLQLEQMEDFIVATGKTHSVREFVYLAFKTVGIDIRFENEGLHEVGVEEITGKVLVTVNPAFFRPVEPFLCVGDSSKALSILGWKAQTQLPELISEMISASEARYSH